MHPSARGRLVGRMMLIVALATTALLCAAADEDVDAARHEIVRRGGTVDVIPASPLDEAFVAVRWTAGNEGLEVLPAAGHVRWLDLSRSSVTDAALANVAKLADLELLYLAETRITDVGLAQLATLGRLRGLFLQSTAVSTAGLAHIAQLREITWLNLSYTKIDGQALAHLKSCRHWLDCGCPTRPSMTPACGIWPGLGGCAA